jgi:folate-binding protein YgfZ
MADQPAPSQRPIHPPLLAGSGAVLAEDGPDRGMPAHYGAPLREQRRLLARRAVVDLGGHEILEVSGADARSWLTTVTSQVLSDAPVGASRSLAVLSPQGRVEHLASAAVTGEETILLVTDPGARAGLRRYLEMMRFAARVEITDRDDLRLLGALAPAGNILGTAALGATGLDLPEPALVWTDPHPAIAPGHIAYGPDPEDGTDWVLTAFDAAALEALPWRVEHLAGSESAEALRIASHRARWSAEVDERSIPHELDLLRTAVHTSKGCYRGQETVAKVLNLGQPPRRLTMLLVDGSQNVMPQHGDPVRLGGSEGKLVGTVTSAATHADLGPIALAVLKRAAPLDAPLVIGSRISGGPWGGADGDGGADGGGAADGDGAADAAARSGSSADEAHLAWLDATQEPIVTTREHGERPRTARL